MGDGTIQRIGVLYDGHLGLIDGVAHANAGMMQALVEKWRGEKFDRIYLVADATNLWMDDPRVVVIVPGSNRDGLARAVEKIVTVDHAAAGTNIHFQIYGHGGSAGTDYYVSGLPRDTFARIVAGIPAAAQRIFVMHNCEAARVLELQKNPALRLRDDNDLLITFAGRKEDKSYESNYTDGRDLGLLHAVDAPETPDSVIGYNEMIWEGVRIALNPLHGLPLLRGLIFDPGPQYVDYGFGVTAAPRSTEVFVTAPRPCADAPHKLCPSVATLNQEIQRGYAQGMTIVGYAGPNAAQNRTDFAKLQTLAKQHGGWIRCIWVDPVTAAEDLKREIFDVMTGPKNSRPPQHTVYTFRFYGANPEHRFDSFTAMDTELTAILSGRAMSPE